MNIGSNDVIRTGSFPCTRISDADSYMSIEAPKVEVLFSAAVMRHETWDMCREIWDMHSHRYWRLIMQSKLRNFDTSDVWKGKITKQLGPSKCVCWSQVVVPSTRVCFLAQFRWKSKPSSPKFSGSSCHPRGLVQFPSLCLRFVQSWSHPSPIAPHY